MSSDHSNPCYRYCREDDDTIQYGVLHKSQPRTVGLTTISSNSATKSFLLLHTVTSPHPSAQDFLVRKTSSSRTSVCSQEHSGQHTRSNPEEDAEGRSTKNKKQKTNLTDVQKKKDNIYTQANNVPPSSL